jgi:hypothetical protein
VADGTQPALANPHPLRQPWPVMPPVSPDKIDVKSAYLNAQLHDDIYMHAPPGYLKAKDLGKVLKLLRSLYGLKQAGFEWSEELEKFFLDAGYTHLHGDHLVSHVTY